MTAIAIILNISLALGIVGVIVGMLLWSVATQHRDHGVFAAGPLVRRRLSSGVRDQHAHIPARQRIATGRSQASLGA